MNELSDLVDLAVTLPASDIDRLADAAAAGPQEVRRLAARSGSPALRGACELIDVALRERGHDFVAGWISGAAALARRSRQTPQVDVVWTGPASQVDTGRLTSEVVTALIGEARTRLLLAAYATFPDPRIITALVGAAGRGVDITVLCERSVDNRQYRSDGDPFAEIPVRRLVWPGDHRPAGAALHPKFIVVDDRIALVGSANLTGRAFDVNIECGVVIRGGPHPKAITDHIWSLLRSGDLESVR